jgi:alcohol dehydrogenase
MSGQQQANFSGSVVYGWPEATDEPAVIIRDNAALTQEDAERLALNLRDEIVIAARPVRADVDQVVERLTSCDANRLVVVGTGALMDAAKLVLQEAASAGIPLTLVMVPCSSEPYRAVARFAVVDAEDGSRPTVVDPRFASCEVIVSPELLSRVPAETVAVAAADTAVHAIESLLSTASTPYSRALAAAALGTVCQTREPSAVLTASFLAVEAFASTRLGIAHAIASPLGTELGVTHDAINAVLGDALVEHWQERTTSFVYAQQACSATGEVDVREALKQLREDAALPPNLYELGVPWQSLMHILPRAAQSSGMTVLPQPMTPPELEAFARRAWKGPTTKEAAVAEPAGAD